MLKVWEILEKRDEFDAPEREDEELWGDAAPERWAGWMLVSDMPVEEERRLGTWRAMEFMFGLGLVELGLVVSLEML